jgi:hypothetical protein
MGMLLRRLVRWGLCESDLLRVSELMEFIMRDERRFRFVCGSGEKRGIMMIEKDFRTCPPVIYSWSIDPVCSAKMEKVRRNWLYEINMKVVRWRHLSSFNTRESCLLVGRGVGRVSQCVPHLRPLVRAVET